MEHLDLVRRQFGANAANYATSPVHAKGASLDRLVALIETRPDWEALDIATAAGHTAFALAPAVARMVATDVTPEMLDVARAGIAERGLDNVELEVADAESLPFDDAAFDLVTCRIAAHHFDDPTAFAAEVARVLRPGGRFGFVDNVVPDDEATARFANEFEARRDPSHVACVSLDGWLTLLTGAGLRIEHTELLSKRMDFATWADNMSVEPAVRAELLADLAGAPPAVTEFLRPELGEAPAFHLTECVIVAAKP